jgi:hypothetical protein
MALLRATIISFDATPHTATVRLDGSAAETLTGVRTSRAIASGDMTAGRRTIVDTGDHNHPDDFVITAVYTA